MNYKHFLPFHKLPFTLLIVFFAVRVSFEVVPLVYFCFYCLCFCCQTQEKHCLQQSHKYFPLNFLLGYNFRSYILDFNPFYVDFCVRGKIRWLIAHFLSFACEYCFSNTVCWRDPFFPIVYSWHPFKAQLTIYVWIYFWPLCSVLLIYMSVSM